MSPVFGDPPTLSSAALKRAFAARELEDLITDRGIGRRLVRSDEPAADIAVLSVRSDLTVWCHNGLASWATHDGYRRRSFADLVEVSEQLVRANEELDFAVGRELALAPA